MHLRGILLRNMDGETYYRCNSPRWLVCLLRIEEKFLWRAFPVAGKVCTLPAGNGF